MCPVSIALQPQKKLANQLALDEQGGHKLTTFSGAVGGKI